MAVILMGISAIESQPWREINKETSLGRFCGERETTSPGE